MKREPGAQNIPSFLGKNLHWFFMGAAAVIMIVRFVPAAYLSAFSSDNVQFPLLFHDVMEQGHNPHDWKWGGHSDLFPDVALEFATQAITRDGLLSLQICGCVLFAVLMVVILVLYRQNGGLHIESFAAILLLFVVGLIDNFGVHHGLRFNGIFTLGIHSGTLIMAMACFALLQHSALKGYDNRFWLLSALCFLTAASDLLFLVIFTVPALITLLVLRFSHARHVRFFAPLVGNVLASSALGLLLARRISPAQIVPGLYTQFSPAHILGSVGHLYKACMLSTGGYFVILLGLDVALVLFVLYLVAVLGRGWAAGRISVPVFMLFLFCALVILCDWGAAIVSGNYTGIGASRYVCLSLLLPPFLMLGCLNALIPWSRNSDRVGCAVISSVAAICAFFLPPKPDAFYLEAQELLPALRSEMQTEGVQEGLADYWYANLLTFLSHDTVRLRSVGHNGSLYYWVNNITWFTGEGTSQSPPAFRMILMANLEPDRIRQCYGEPARIVHVPTNKDIWIYSKEKQIAFNRLFGELANSQSWPAPNEYKVTASLLPSNTGKLDGNSIVAEAEQSRPGYLTYGPYLHLQSGLYRIRIGYEYLAAPEPGKYVNFDCVQWKSSASQILDHAEVPFIDVSRREFTRDIRISGGEGDVVEARTYYRGSGSIRIESLSITYLKP